MYTQAWRTKLNFPYNMNTTREMPEPRGVGGGGCEGDPTEMRTYHFAELFYGGQWNCAKCNDIPCSLTLRKEKKEY